MSSTEIVGAMPPPEGVTPDFSLDRTSVQNQFIMVYAITLSIAMLLLLMRLYTRMFIVKSVGLDDFAVIGSAVFSIAFFALCVESMKYGFGRHLWNVPATALQNYLVLLIPIVVTYCWAPFMTKFSILILYHRLNPSKNFRYIIYFLMFVIAGYTLATTFATAAGCNPLHTDKTPCINSLALWQAILNIVTDFLMLLLPIPLLWALQLPLRQKIALGFIFAIGSAVVITSIIRITYIMNILHDADLTWSEATVCVWSAIELNFGIMCNCLAVLKPFVRHVFPMLVPSSRGAERYATDDSYPSRHRKRTGSHKLSSLNNVERSAGSYGHSNSHSQSVKHPDGNGITVTSSYQVHSRTENGDTSSTENIIESDGVVREYHRMV